jgi:hypothetical protein
VKIDTITRVPFFLMNLELSGNDFVIRNPQDGRLSMLTGSQGYVTVDLVNC